MKKKYTVKLKSNKMKMIRKKKNNNKNFQKKIMNKFKLTKMNYN